MLKEYKEKKVERKFPKIVKILLLVACLNFICLLVIYYNAIYALNMKCMSCVKCQKQ